MGTVLIEHAQSNRRAHFQLVDDRLHVPTIREWFKLNDIKLNDVVCPADPSGFTFLAFRPGDTVHVTGEPLMDCTAHRVLIIKHNEAIKEHEDGKRRVVQVDENIGLWRLPQKEHQPATVAELAASIKAYLGMDQHQQQHSGTANGNANGHGSSNGGGSTWLFKYRYFGEMVPILSDNSLEEALAHFRAMSSCQSEEAALQHCRLYVTMLSGELGAREILRAHMHEVLDAAADAAIARVVPRADGSPLLTSIPQPRPVQQQPAPPQHPQPQAPQLVPVVPGPTPVAVATSGQPQAQQLATHAPDTASVGLLAMAQQAAATAVAATPGPFFSPEAAAQLGFGAATALDQALPAGAMPSPQQQAAHFAGLQTRAPDAGAGTKAQSFKESKTRYPDGRFRSDEQHQRKMGDMHAKCMQMFDGQIQDVFEVLDHKKIKCKVCDHATTAYSPYHTDCLRKHFLRHHEQLLLERGVDILKWKKGYELPTSQQPQQPQQPQQQQGRGGRSSNSSKDGAAEASSGGAAAAAVGVGAYTAEMISAGLPLPLPQPLPHPHQQQPGPGLGSEDDNPQHGGAESHVSGALPQQPSALPQQQHQQQQQQVPPQPTMPQQPQQQLGTHPHQHLPQVTQHPGVVASYGLGPLGSHEVQQQDMQPLALLGASIVHPGQQALLSQEVLAGIYSASLSGIVSSLDMTSSNGQAAMLLAAPFAQGPGHGQAGGGDDHHAAALAAASAHVGQGHNSGTAAMS